MFQGRVYRDLDHRVSSGGAEKRSNCGYGGRANKITGTLDVQVNRERSQGKPQVLKWTIGNVGLALTETGKGDRSSEDSNRFYLFNFIFLREKGGGGERESERNTDRLPPVCAPIVLPCPHRVTWAITS